MMQKSRHDDFEQESRRNTTTERDDCEQGVSQTKPVLNV